MLKELVKFMKYDKLVADDSELPPNVSQQLNDDVNVTIENEVQ